MKGPRTWLLTVSLALVGALAHGAGDGEWETIWRETFDDWDLGAVPASAKEWQAHADGKNRIETAKVGDGRAVCLLDVTKAVRQASCRLRRTLSARPGSYRISYRTMLRQGRAESLSQDMGFHLFDPGVLFDVFFSGGAIKTWQEEGWTGLDPPVPWQADHWYEIVIEVSPADGQAKLSVDGTKRKTVSLRRTGGQPVFIEFVSQRYAIGELWIDDVVLEHRSPPELSTTASKEWRQANLQKRTKRWFADEDSKLTWGKLRNTDGHIAVARRAIATDFTGNPTLQLDLKTSPGTTPRIYLRRIPTGEVVTLAPTPDQRYALFAATGWDGVVEAELLVTLNRAGELKLGKVTVQADPVVNYRNVGTIGRFVKPSRKANQLPRVLPIRVQGTPGEAVPVHFGLPFPERALSQPDSLLLQTKDGVPLPLQTRPLSYWSDGSVRWLLVDTQAALPKLGQTTIFLADGKKVRKELPLIGVETEESITLDNGLLQFTMPRLGFSPIAGLPAPCDGSWDFIVRADGRTYRASQGVARVRLEDTGPVRATAIVSGTLADAVDVAFKYELRLSLGKGSQEIEIKPTFLFVGSQPECQLEEASFVLGTQLKPADITFGADVPHSLYRAAGQSIHLLQDQLDHYTVARDDAEMATGKRASGWLLTDGLCLAMRRFPEQFRKGFRVTDTEIRAELWAPGAARRFGRGAAKTHDMVLSFGVAGRQEAESLAERNQHPAILYPGGEWLARSLGLGEFPLPTKETQDLDALFETACERRFTEAARQPKRAHGMVNYGETAHINSEIDAHVAFFLQWARTGKRRWLDAALDWAQHSQDIDVCHASTNAREIGIHHNHYPSDHNNGGLTLTHTWIRGQLFRYYLAGDQRSLLAANRAGLAFRRNLVTEGRLLDGGRPGAGIGSRGYGRASWALTELFQATRNPVHLRTMNRLNQYLAANLRADGAVPANHNGAGIWSSTDECPHMAAICAVGLARYAAELPKDQAEPHRQALRRIADWQLSRGAMPEKLGIMYHNYPGGEVIHFVDACSDMLEAWIALYETTGNPLYRDLAESIYDNLIEMGDQWHHDWTMCARNVLFYVARRQRLLKAHATSFAPAPHGADAAFLNSCQSPDGGFGLAPGLPSDMDSTYRALDALRLLGQPIPHAARCAEWILSCQHASGGYAGEPGWYPNVAWTHFALQSLLILGVDPPRPKDTLEWLRICINEDGGSGSCPVTGPKPYHPAWRSATEYTSYAVQAIGMLGGQLPNVAQTRAFLLARQSNQGGFNRWRGRANTVYTALALDALRRLEKRPNERDYQTGVATWLVSLRHTNGGYSWDGGKRTTLRNTEHVLRSFRSLQVSLPDEDLELTREYVRSCRAPNGGFGHRPGRTPTVVHTWYGVRAAVMLAPIPKPDAIQGRNGAQ